VKILLEGHTDNVGSESYNLELSANRAEAVYKALINRGVDAGRLDYKGFGFSRPAGSNDTPEGRSRNRRTEVLIH
jgi:outer membrane protein OmpA-like peptidoglycan-associated protein